MEFKQSSPSRPDACPVWCHVEVADVLGPASTPLAAIENLKAMVIGCVFLPSAHWN